MATMTRKTKPTEKEIDRIVVSQADDDKAWGKPVRAHRKKSASVSIPPKLAARAAFLAQIHRKKSVEEWLTRVIEERIELEEAAFVGVKQDLSTKAG
jgi:predicted HicB family RNase H-like nuclease